MDINVDHSMFQHLGSYRQVTSVHAAQAPFIIRMRSEEFERAQAKLHSSIRNVKNVVIMQSVSDRYMQVSPDVCRALRFESGCGARRSIARDPSLLAAGVLGHCQGEHAAVCSSFVH